MVKGIFSVVFIVVTLGIVFLGTLSLVSEDGVGSGINAYESPNNILPEWISVQGEEAMPLEQKLIVWIPTGKFQTSSLVKVPRFPRKYSEDELIRYPRLSNLLIKPVEVQDSLRINVVQNEMFSGQISIISREPIKGMAISLDSLVSDNGSIIEAKDIQIRYVGYVPVQRGGSEYEWSARYEEVVEPGFSVSGTMRPDVVADPLFPLTLLDVPAYQNQPVWISIKIPDNPAVLSYHGNLIIESDEIERSISLSVAVGSSRIPDTEHYLFYTDFWLNPYAISGYYGLSDWSEAHWAMVEKYMRMLSGVGAKTVTAVIVDQPWRIPWLNGDMRPQTNNGYRSMVKWIKHKDDSWSFDYSVFDRYVKLGQANGLTGNINVYSLTSFRGNERITFFDEKTGTIQEQMFESPKDKQYQNLWKIFLNHFYRHLRH